MKKLFHIAIILGILTQPLLAVPVLQERLKDAKVGDYIVAESNKMISLLAIRSLNPHSLVLEEIDAPVSALDPKPSSWGEWIHQRAPGHSSWSMVEIDLDHHQLIECYSFTRCAWIQLSEHESLISTILGLPLEIVPTSDQRRIGPEPMNGEPDVRQIWQPPLFEEGKRLENIEFNVYRAEWPQDGSELAGNRVFLYFDKLNRMPFPAWIQMQTAHVAASLRIIDSGKNLPSLHRTLPRRVPEFIGVPQKSAEGLRLTIKSPKYFQSFELFAIDVTTCDKEILPIDHSLVLGEGEILHLDIEQSELQNTLQDQHRYNWLIVPSGHSEFYCESPKSFIWKSE